MSKKTSIVGFVLIALALVGAGAFFAMQSGESLENGEGATTTPSVIIPQAKVSIEGWKTCRNTKYGYEFMYPGDWHAFELAPNPGFPGAYNEMVECVTSNTYFYISDVILEESFNTKEESQLGIRAEKNEVIADTETRKGFKTIEEYIASLNNSQEKYNEYLIGGTRAVTRASYNYLILFHNDTVYTIDFLFIKNPDLVETILSTFKFTN